MGRVASEDLAVWEDHVVSEDIAVLEDLVVSEDIVELVDHVVLDDRVVSEDLSKTVGGTTEDQMAQVDFAVVGSDHEALHCHCLPGWNSDNPDVRRLSNGGEALVGCIEERLGRD